MDSIKSEQTDKLFTALAKAQGQMKNAPYDKMNPHFKSKYASLTALWDACRAILEANGLCLAQTLSKADCPSGIALTTYLGHISGQYITSTMPLITSKLDVQGIGGAITYAKRYQLSAMLGINGDDDDDGEAEAIISSDQVEKIFLKVLETKDPAATFKIMLQNGQIDSVHKIRQDRFPKIMGWLEKMMQAHKEV